MESNQSFSDLGPEGASNAFRVILTAYSVPVVLKLAEARRERSAAASLKRGDSPSGEGQASPVRGECPGSLVNVETGSAEPEERAVPIHTGRRSRLLLR